MKRAAILSLALVLGMNFSFGQNRMKVVSDASNDDFDYVSLIDFSFMTAHYKHGKAFIVWETVKEININYYTIEKTINGGDIRDVGFVNGFRYSKINRKYIFHDEFPLEGTAFYRLKIRDFNGNVTYTEWVLLDDSFRIGVLDYEP